QKMKLHPSEISSLTDYFSTKLTTTGAFKLVPNTDLKAMLAEKKKDSYAKCYETSCQIEIGKELAAQKSLSTKILLVGKKCDVTATVFDLRDAASERSADDEGSCDVDSLREALKRIAARLADRGERTEPVKAPVATAPVPAP